MLRNCRKLQSPSTSVLQNQTTVSQTVSASLSLVDHPGRYDFHHDFVIVVMVIQMMMPFCVICARLESQRDASKFHTSGLIVILVESGCIRIVPLDGIMSLVSIYVSIAFNFVKSWCIRPASYLHNSMCCIPTCLLPS